MKRFFLFYFFLICALPMVAQPDSANMVKYTPRFEFNEGLYLNFEQIKKNAPVPKSKIVANFSYDDPDFFAKLIEQKTISLYDELGTRREVKTKDIWGFSQHGKVYVNLHNEFNRVPYIGNISHFVADKTVYNSNYNNYPYSYYNPYYYNPYYYNQPQSTSVEMRQYLLDFETGKVLDYNLKNVEVLLMRDPELHDEFMALRKRKRKKSMFLYLRKYNDKHPLFFPLGK